VGGGRKVGGDARWVGWLGGVGPIVDEGEN
jgi:hypothetical protein